MSQNYMAILNLEESERDIRSLTSFRPIATIPFAGRYRIIDFMLSNIVNAGITKVGVFANKITRSLPDHLGSGKPWDLSRKIGGLYIFDHGLLGYNNFDVKMFGNNMEFLQRSIADNVIVSSSYMIYNIDLENVIEAHENSENDVTAVYTKTDRANTEFMNCAVVNFDSTGKIIGIGKNLGMQRNANICTELFVMKKEILLQLIYKSMRTGNRKSFNSYLYSQIDEINMGAYEFKGEIKCINSIQAYFNAHMEIIENEKLRNSWFKNTDTIYTKTKDSPPAFYASSAKVANSIVADGCRVEGNIKNCVLSRFVKIGKGAKLENCIILQGTTVGEGAQLSNVIVEKNNIVNPYTQIVGTRDFPIVIEHKNTSAMFDASPQLEIYK
ncbi:MAG: glucose-1-phosphate adenylyltransferase subunit GlgD [Clostridia bacterium]|nr:glucose-1-phosphate adenylyltransferase subunit GlgD [Clostridia bacterium]